MSAGYSQLLLYLKIDVEVLTHKHSFDVNGEFRATLANLLTKGPDYLAQIIYGIQDRNTALIIQNPQDFFAAAGLHKCPADD